MSGLCWANILDCTDRGPRSNLANAVLVLQHDPQFAPDRLWYDEFLDRVLTRDGDTPREWRDTDDAHVTVYLQQNVNMNGIAEPVVASAVRYVANQRRRHCVREWLSGLTWDGTPRIAHAFEDHWGAEPSSAQPSDYIRAISANFFLSFVARIMRPGCQVDNMVVFEGDQGIRKSSALQVLSGEWFMVASESVTHKDFFQALAGKALIEVSEMESFSRAERERVKAVITTRTDRYRPSFGRRTVDYPRQCIFAGTTNRDDWGNDDTGLRRFWPLRCGTIDLVTLAGARDQLFAEAVSLFRAGATWWETPDSAKHVQADRQHEDAWTSDVLTYVQFRDQVTSVDILVNALKMPAAHIDRKHESRISSILRLRGWKRQAIRVSGEVVKGYRRRDDVSVT
jgi:putative DNA primase/helicase